MPARRCEHECRAGLVLAGHLGQVQPSSCRPTGRHGCLVGRVEAAALALRRAVGEHELPERAGRGDPHPLDEPGLGHVLGCDDDVLAAGGLRGEHRRQHPGDVPQPPVEAELGEVHDGSYERRRQLLAGGEDGDGDAEIEARAVLGDRCGRQVDRQLAGVEREAGGDRRCPHPLGCLAQRRVGQAADVEGREPSPDVALDVDEVTGDPAQRHPAGHPDAHCPTPGRKSTS